MQAGNTVETKEIWADGSNGENLEPGPVVLRGSPVEMAVNSPLLTFLALFSP